MGKAHRRAAIALGILLACCACAFALDPSLDISQYAHTAWKSRDGFVRGYISDIVQTPDGYLWLGTEFGLYRFDGVRAVPWQPPGQQLPDALITSLLVARDGTLWIGTLKGLATWKDGKLKTYPELSGQAITALVQDHEGTIWFGSSKLEGLLVAQLCSSRGDHLECQGGEGRFGPMILSLYEDSKLNLWVGVAKGLWKWKPGVPEFVAAPQSVAGIFGFAEDDEGAILLGNSTTILRLVDGRFQPYQSTGSSRALAPQRLLRDRDGRLWVGTYGFGLAHIYRESVDTFSEADGLSSGFVSKVFEDREGDVWVGTMNGLDRFREYAVPNVSVKQGLSIGVALSLLAASDGSIWIATSGGLNVWKNGQISHVVAPSDTAKHGDRVKASPPASLFQDSAGRIWIGTRNDFGYLENDRFVRIRDFPRSEVTDLVEESPGNMWVATQFAGLIHLVDRKIVQQIPWAALGHKDLVRVTVVDPSRAGTWLGFRDGGVAYFTGGRIQKQYSAAEGLGRGRVNHLRFGPGGALWVGTESGLSRIKDGRITTLTGKNGLPCDNVHWSVEDGDHNVWLKTPCGVLRITRADMDAWVASPTIIVKPTDFDVSDGVPSHSNATGYAKPVVTGTDEKIWFIGLDGVSVIDPHHLAFNKIPPPVHIERVTADDKPYDATNGLRLPPHVRYLAIDYTALSLVAPEKVRFRYKLEGEDKDWREVVNDREVQYTNLAPKHYRFRVIAANNSGVWNEEGATLNFVIPPAWYQTNWFYALCVAAFLAMVWGIYELRVRQLAAQFNMRLEERVAERTRVARDLHDTLLQSFQGLLPSLQAGINMLAARPADARKVLEATADHASQAIAEGRDAVQGLRMSTVEKNDLAVAIRTIGEELASAASSEPSPNFNVVVEGASRNLHPILRDEVYRLAVEALRNAFRHAAAQNVEVEIRYDEKYFRLRVRDDGKGIPSDVLSGDGREGHYGLPGMRERAKLVGGKLAIWTELDGGTEIELNIPGARAYVKSTRTFWHFGKRSATDTDEKEPIERE